MTKQEIKQFIEMIAIAGEKFKDEPEKLREILLPIKEQLERNIKA